MKAKYFENEIMEGQGLIGDLFGKVIDKTQRFSGERHTPLMTSKGPKIATYTGPHYMKMHVENEVNYLVV